MSESWIAPNAISRIAAESFNIGFISGKIKTQSYLLDQLETLELSQDERIKMLEIFKNSFDEVKCDNPHTKTEL